MTESSRGLVFEITEQLHTEQMPIAALAFDATVEFLSNLEVGQEFLILPRWHEG